MFDLGAERLRHGAALRVGVGITDPFGAESDRGRDCVQPDRGCRAADDEDLGARTLGEVRAHRPVAIDQIVGQRAQHRRRESVGCRHKKVIGDRNGEKVGDGAAVAASRGSETERPAGGCPIGAAPTEMPGAAGVARTARHLERNHYPVAYAAPRDGVADRDDLGNRFVSDRERPQKQTLRCHRQINVTLAAASCRVSAEELRHR